MRGWRKLVAGSLCTAWRWSRRWRGVPSRRILMYHAIGTSIAEDAAGLYTLAPARFAEQMRWLAERRLPVAALGDAEAPAGSCVITFDDGYRDNLTVAAPILAGLGLPFTVFICRDFVRSGSGVYLDPARVRELAAFPGASVGCHGASHRPLTSCSDAELADELAGCRAWLEDLIQRPVVSMSYPHGAVDRRVRDAAAAAGFRIGATSRFGANRGDEDPLLLSRTDIWSDDTLVVFGDKLSGDWDWLGWRR